MPKFQKIYADALRRPREGYAAHSLFLLAPFRCPRCQAPVWVRVAARTGHTIGAVCQDCPWLTTHLQKGPPLDGPTQPCLPGAGAELPVRKSTDVSARRTRTAAEWHAPKIGT